MASFSHNNYDLKVRDHKSLDGFSGVADVTDSVLVFVYDAGTKTLSTIYADDQGTAKANPITRAQFATDGGVKFRSPATSHDICLAHADGSNGQIASVTPVMHCLPLNRDGADKVIIVPFGVSDNAEVDTGIDIPVHSHIHNLAVEVVAIDATEDLSIGLLSSETNGDADGLVATISVGTAGFVKPFVVTTGSSETYVSVAKFGALMGAVATGADDANADTGVGHAWGHVVSGANAKSLTYTGSSGSDTAAGYIYVYLKRLR